MTSLLDAPSPPRVLVTRPAEDAPSLANALARAGFQPVLVPLVERRWLLDPVTAAARDNPCVDWVFVTSATAANVLATAAPGAWHDARWAAVGDATAARLQQLGYPVHVVPSRATAADLVTALGAIDGTHVAYPRADLANPATLQALRDAGAEIVDVVAYANVAPEGHAEELRTSLPVEATTLMSGSAAARLAEALDATQQAGLGRIVCIGPSTAKVARSYGLEVHAVAYPHSLQGLLGALNSAVP